MAWDCSAYYDYLFDQTPHFDSFVLEDWFPTDSAWMGHVETEQWDPETGTQHTYDRIHVGFPDLSGCWQTFDVQDETCVSGACSPEAKTVAWGSSRFSYGRERRRYQTNVLCFDQINTRAKAKLQFREIVKGIKEISKVVQSDYLRRNALQKNDTIFISDDRLLEIPITGTTFNADCTRINLGSEANLPLSQMTIQYLQRFYEPLQFEGYFKNKTVPNGMFKLITDTITSQQLYQANPSLIANFRFTDFQKGGELFKYGISAAVGNYGISWDDFPMRFYHIGGGVLLRVFPYTNVAATIGIKRQVAAEYLRAPYQVNYVWHPEAMKRLVPNLESVHPEMPFMTRDLGGKWYFTGPDSDALVITDPVTGDTCTIDNKARNQGLWWSDFENSIRFERPELTRAILSLREPGCVSNMPACSEAPPYVVQDYADVNPVCEDLA
jgi:hypothetical protein